MENTCLYRRKETPKPENTESSADWLKRKEQPRNERGQFTSPDKSVGKPMDLNLSMVSDDEFQCYNTSEGKPVHANIDDELQLLPKETNLTPETGIKTNPLINEPQQTVRKSKRIPNARQTEKNGADLCLSRLVFCTIDTLLTRKANRIANLLFFKLPNNLSQESFHICPELCNNIKKSSFQTILR